MKIPVFAAVLLLAVMLSGCVVYSLQPVVAKEDAVSSDAIVGSWKDPDSKDPEVIRFEKSGPNGYTMGITDAATGLAQTYDVRLIRLGKYLFADVAFKALRLKDQDVESPAGLLSVHMILKMETGPDTLSTAMLNDEWLKKEVAANRISIPHAVTEDGEILLTASTPELQKFFLAHAEDGFPAPGLLTRVK